ncbi:MAG: hypothetical protein DSY42_00645 [Aquifex sp.]|nr:MAG: hypothetical protein DSY42_00645 [Aquifex sp.]
MLVLLIFFSIVFSFSSELQKLINIAIEKNERIKSYYFEKRAFIHRGKFFLSIPNPQLKFSLRNFDTEVPIARKENPMSSYAITFTQNYILPAKRDRKFKIFVNKSKEVDVKEEIFKKNLIKTLSFLYYDYVFSLEKENILKEILEDLKFLEKITDEKYVYGKALLSDILMLKSEILKTEREILSVKAEREKILAGIKALLYEEINLKGEKLRLKPFPKDFNPNTSVYTKLVKEELNTLMWEYKLAKVQHLPDISFSVDYAVRPDLPDMFSISVGITLPIWYKNREKYLVLESINRIKAKKKELKDTIITLKREYEGLEKKYTLLKEALESLDSEIKTKEGEIESLLIAYKYDETDIREILRAYKILWQLKIEKKLLITHLNKIVAEAEALR